MSWSDTLDSARGFEADIRQKWPAFYDEMLGVAEGSGRSILDIVALNVRMEIAFGQFSDGCTSLAWHTQQRAYLGQHWDWSERQKENLIIVKISQPGKPSIQMITEAGIIGKIGFNSDGVGVCFNAIRAKGVDRSRVPVHLGLRLILESSSAKQAVRSLEGYGMAAAAHTLVADKNSSIGFEFSLFSTARLRSDSKVRLMHSNHLLAEHPGVTDTVWLKDSPFRTERMAELSETLQDPTWDEVSRLFEDEKNTPAAICRAQAGTDDTTIFNIIMDLKQRQGIVRMGRPCDVEETIKLGV